MMPDHAPDATAGLRAPARTHSRVQGAHSGLSAKQPGVTSGVPDVDLRTDLDVAIAAARAGAGVVRRSFGRDIDPDLKSVVDPVTEVDRAAEAAIREVLVAMRPEDEVLGEEGGGAGDRQCQRGGGGTGGGTGSGSDCRGSGEEKPGLRRIH